MLEGERLPDDGQRDFGPLSAEKTPARRPAAMPAAAQAVARLMTSHYPTR